MDTKRQEFLQSIGVNPNKPPISMQKETRPLIKQDNDRYSVIEELKDMQDIKLSQIVGTTLSEHQGKSWIEIFESLENDLEKEIILIHKDGAYYIEKGNFNVAVQMMKYLTEKQGCVNDSKKQEEIENKYKIKTKVIEYRRDSDLEHAIDLLKANHLIFEETVVTNDSDKSREIRTSFRLKGTGIVVNNGKEAESLVADFHKMLIEFGRKSFDSGPVNEYTGLVNKLLKGEYREVEEYITKLKEKQEDKQKEHDGSSKHSRVVEKFNIKEPTIKEARWGVGILKNITKSMNKYFEKFIKKYIQKYKDVG